jgi:hypothetical protein
MTRFKPGSPGRELADALEEVSKAAGDELEYAVVEKSNEKRITVGVVYSPDVIDAHDEYADADTLEEAVYGYMEAGDLDVRKQHTDEKIGKIVGIMTWPFETEVELKKLGVQKSTKTVKLPPGTVYATAKWNEGAWEDVKAGRITGFSMGGGAVRIRA